MQRTRLLIAATILAVATTARASGGTTSRWVIAGGGETGQSQGAFTHHGTLGQPVASPPTGSDEILSSGFWGGRVSRGDGSVYLPLVVASAGGPLQVHEAPDTCPGLSIQIGKGYREDFDHSNDNDWYAFAATPGQPTTIETGDLDVNADTFLYLYAPGCATLIAQNDDRADGDPSSRISWTPSAGGQYHVMVRSYDYQVFGPGTGYTLWVTVGESGVDLGAPPREKAPVLPTPVSGGER